MFVKDDCYNWRSVQISKLPDQALIEKYQYSLKGYKSIIHHIKTYATPYLHKFLLLRLAVLTQIEDEAEKRDIKLM